MTLIQPGKLIEDEPNLCWIEVSESGGWNTQPCETLLLEQVSHQIRDPSDRDHLLHCKHQELLHQLLSGPVVGRCQAEVAQGILTLIFHVDQIGLNFLQVCLCDERETLELFSETLHLAAVQDRLYNEVKERLFRCRV